MSFYFLRHCVFFVTFCAQLTCAEQVATETLPERAQVSTEKPHTDINIDAQRHTLLSCQRALEDQSAPPLIKVFLEEFYTEQSLTLLGAETFSAALNPNCCCKTFAHILGACPQFSRQQVWMAVNAYYRGQLPQTDKIALLTENASIESLQNFLQTVNNPAPQNTSAFCEKNTICAVGHQTLWICKWVQARAELLTLYKAAFPHGQNAKSTEIFNTDCPFGAFQPHTFLSKLLEAEASGSVYLFQHMEVHEFAALAYAWIPALYNTQTMSLFSEILEKHLPYDPEKQTLKEAAIYAGQLFFRCDGGKPLQGFTQLIEGTWRILNGLAYTSQTQWEHCINSLRQIDGLKVHIDAHPDLVTFRERTFPGQKNFVSKASFCLKNDLSVLQKKRHELVAQQSCEVAAYADHITGQNNALCVATSEILQSYIQNTEGNTSSNSFEICAHLTQQSALFKSLSFIRSILFWTFALTKPNPEKLQKIESQSPPVETLLLLSFAHNASAITRKSYPTTLIPWIIMRATPNSDATYWTILNQQLTHPSKHITKNILPAFAQTCLNACQRYNAEQAKKANTSAIINSTLPSGAFNPPTP